MVTEMFDFTDPQNAWSLAQSLLVLVGFTLVIWQIRIASEQNSIAHLNHFRENWNSEPMLSTRLAVCEHYPKTGEEFFPQDGIVAAFLEDLAAAVHVSQTNKKHAWSYFSYYVGIYWAMLGPTIEKYQNEIDDETYFHGFQSLIQEFWALGAREGATLPKGDTLRRLIAEEIGVIKFRKLVRI